MTTSNKESLNLTVKKVAECTEEALRNIKLQEAVSKAETCRGLAAADAKKSMEALKGWEESTSKLDENVRDAAG